MTLAEFKGMAQSEQVSTTNGWGFNGYYGTKFTSGKFTFYQTKWSHRHSGDSQYHRYYIGGIETTTPEFIAALEMDKSNHSEYKEYVRPDGMYIAGIWYTQKAWRGGKLVDNY